MRKLLFITLALSLLSCNNNEDNFILKGKIKGLKKGSVYLLKAQDTTFTALDSVVINGNAEFTLSTTLQEPEVLFIQLDKNDDDNTIIDFFASEGITTFNSTLKNFIYDADIQGSEQQNLFNEYRKMIYAFRNKNLEIIEQHLQAQVSNDTTAIDSLANSYNNYIKSKYRYSLNYAITHNSSEIAPYIALSEMPDATINALDTLYNSLTEEVKNSKYGKLLREEITKKKE